MGTLAVIIKHLHVWLVVLSISGFAMRFALSLKGSSHLQQKWVRVAPHVIDTLLLVTGVSLAGLFQLSPIQTSWLGAKLILVIVYIFLGILALRGPISRLGRQIAGILALLTAGAIIFLAVYKPALF
jgi:uncharacterized membrane protein SirB2